MFKPSVLTSSGCHLKPFRLLGRSQNQCICFCALCITPEPQSRAVMGKVQKTFPTDLSQGSCLSSSLLPADSGESKADKEVGKRLLSLLRLQSWVWSGVSFLQCKDGHYGNVLVTNYIYLREWNSNMKNIEKKFCSFLRERIITLDCLFFSLFFSFVWITDSWAMLWQNQRFPKKK